MVPFPTSASSWTSYCPCWKPGTRALAGRLRPARERASGMGGFGALNLAARTGAFSRCLALSPAFVDAPFTSYQWFIRRSLRRTFPLDPVLFAPWNPWSHLGGDAELVIGAGTGHLTAAGSSPWPTPYQAWRRRLRSAVNSPGAPGPDWF